MRQEKAIYIITHHNEIDKSFADYEIKIVKEQNTSYIQDFVSLK